MVQQGLTVGEGVAGTRNLGLGAGGLGLEAGEVAVAVAVGRKRRGFCHELARIGSKEEINRQDAKDIKNNTKKKDYPQRRKGLP